MTQPPLRISIFGLSITSSWGNGHATTYRSLVKGLVQRGHHVVFHERRRPWYEANQDLRFSNLCEIVVYDSLAELNTMQDAVIQSDLVMIGSYVPEAVQLAEWALERTGAVTAFYDIDTPVTVAALKRGSCQYLTPALVPEFDLYLSFSGGPVVETLRHEFGARQAHPLYCSVDPEQYFPLQIPRLYDLGYLGTYSEDRQPKLNRLLCEAARTWPGGRFCVAGSQYPASLHWPRNVNRIEHVPPIEHCRFYNSQRYTLNITREDMVEKGFSPSVRLFEAAACAVPVICDEWAGLEQFFTPDSEILIARTEADVLAFLRNLTPEVAREIGARAREKVLREHTSQHRAQDLETYVAACRATPASPTEHPVRVTRATGAVLH